MNDNKAPGNGEIPTSETVSSSAETQEEQSTAGTESASANEPIDPQTSERKKAANRENAQHSTGPKTTAGKDAVNYNGQKHGMYAKDVVIPHGFLKENEEEYKILLEDLERSWNPTDAMQKMLVGNIAEFEWRRRRGRCAEIGEILKQSNMSDARQAASVIETYGVRYSQRLSPSLTTTLDVTGIVSELTKQLTLVKQVREQVVERGYVCSTLQKALDDYFGKNNDFPTRCYEISREAERLQSPEESGSSDAELDMERLREGHGGERHSGQNHGGQNHGDQHHGGQRFDAEFCKRTLLGLIDNRIEALEYHLVQIRQAGEVEYEANLRASLLPPKEFLDRLNRFETQMEKNKERAINSLRKLKEQERKESKA